MISKVCHSISPNNFNIYTIVNHASDPLSIAVPCCSTWMPPFRDSLYFVTNSSENQAIGLHFPTYGSPNPNCGDKPDCGRIEGSQTPQPNAPDRFNLATLTLVLPLNGEG
jgi:hypothetical protein